LSQNIRVSISTLIKEMMMMMMMIIIMIIIMENFSQKISKEGATCQA